MKYRRKPSVVEAFRFTADAEIDSPEWFAKAVQDDSVFIDRCITDGTMRVYGCTVYSRTGKLKAKVGDWIVSEVSGEIRPLKEKQFEREYERA